MRKWLRADLHMRKFCTILALLIGIVIAISLPRCNRASAESAQSWPRLTDQQKTVLGQRLKAIPEFPGVAIAIYMDCDCFGFAQDIDDAARFAGVESVISPVPEEALDQGVEVTFDNISVALKVLDALAATTHGEIELSFNPISHDVAAGRAVIFVGKYPKRE
jgi:hypothetical protein